MSALIEAARPGTVAEHVGSTAVPGLAGKGVVDLVIETEPANVPAVVQALYGLGFAAQDHPDPFPPTRPMLTGSVIHDGNRFDLHVHVVPAGGGELDEMRRFRDRLRAEPELCRAYEGEKRRVLATIGESVEYSYEKGAFVEAATPPPPTRHT